MSDNLLFTFLHISQTHGRKRESMKLKSTCASQTHMCVCKCFSLYMDKIRNWWITSYLKKVKGWEKGIAKRKSASPR
jgi:hypothetical protein